MTKPESVGEGVRVGLEIDDSSTLIERLETYNELFKNRYTNDDPGYVEVLNRETSKPPCVENWYCPPSRPFYQGRSGNRQGHQYRGQSHQYRGQGHQYRGQDDQYRGQGSDSHRREDRSYSNDQRDSFRPHDRSHGYDRGSHSYDRGSHGYDRGEGYRKRYSPERGYNDRR